MRRGPYGPTLSLTARLALLFAIGSSAVLLVLGWVIGAEIERHFVRMDSDMLRNGLLRAQHVMAAAGDTRNLPTLSARLRDELDGFHGLDYEITAGVHGPILLSSRRTAFFPAARLATDAAPAAAQPFDWTWQGRPLRGMVAALAPDASDSSTPSLQPPLIVGVAVEIGEHQAFMQAFNRTLWMFMAGAAVLTGLLGWVAARRGLAPLRAMRERAASITAERLDRRLPANAVPPELGDLATTLNETFQRLEESFRRLSHFSSDIAHELRTPLSNLMTETQVCLSRERTADGYRAVLESNVEEFERLSQMISQMLFLAKAENGLIVPDRAPLDLAELVRKLFDFYEALADERGIRLRLEGSAIIEGDALMLSRAVSNLLSNAIRHAAEASTIVVLLRMGGTEAELSVENRGETVPPAQLARIFDRFYRADPARHHAAGEGAGLGLAITRAIVSAHGGELTATSESGTTRLTMRLPVPQRSDMAG